MLGFQFTADIWGTVSEWVMIVVTTLTAYFLYKTLQSQKEVQKDQNRLLEIEQIRLRQAFKPDLKYSRCEVGEIIKETSTEFLKGRRLISMAVRNITANQALNIQLVHRKDKEVEVISKPDIQNLPTSNERIFYHFAVQPFDAINHSCDFSFSVTYEDAIGTKYRENISCFVSPSKEEFVSSLPKLVSK